MNDRSPSDRRPSALRQELSARVGFATHLFDRAAAERDNDAARAEAERDPAVRFAVVAGDRPVLAAAGEGQFTVWHDAAALEGLGREQVRVWLGREADGAPRFGVRLEPEAAEALKTRLGVLVLDLRSLAIQGLVPPAELGASGTTKAMTDWHARHGFCAQCGAPTAPVQGGFRRDCPACKAQHFPRTDPVTIMLVTHGERCLLARQARFAPNSYSCIAGFVEPGESIEDAVRRETLEETGLTIGRVAYLASQPWPFPSSLMIGCLAEAIDDEIVLDGTELEAGRWFHRDEARQILAGQHPAGIVCPPRIAIANTLLRAWVTDGVR